MATIEELAAKVAELEQQMAAITAPPTEYYTSAYSGEEIDAAVKKVSEGLAGGVTSFNGRTGAVKPQAGDYNATQIPVSGEPKAETVAAALSNKAPGILGKPGPVSAAGWYRIAVIHGNTSRPDSFIVSVGHNYAANGPSTILASVTTTGYARRITILDSSYKSGTYPIDALRLMSLSENELALDIHYAINVENFINSSFILGLSDPSQLVPQVPTSVQDAPPGETLEALDDWLNPPMQLGVEYRTTERYNGKPVYKKAVNTGALSAGTSKSVAHGVQNIGLRLSALYGLNNNGDNLVSNPGITGILVDGSNITITTAEGFSIKGVRMKIIKYQLATEINHGTPEEPDIETLLSPVTVTYTEEAYAFAQAEAYQGQITVEDDGRPEPEPEPEYVTYAELAKAIREGVNEV